MLTLTPFQTSRAAAGAWGEASCAGVSVGFTVKEGKEVEAQGKERFSTLPRRGKKQANQSIEKKKTRRGLSTSILIVPLSFF